MHVKRHQAEAENLWVKPFHSASTPRRKNLHSAISLWKRTQFFPSTQRRRNLKHNKRRSFWICVWGKFGQGNSIIILTPSFLKSFVFKMFSLHAKTSRRFHSPSSRSSFKKLHFCDGLMLTVGSTVEIESCVSKFPQHSLDEASISAYRQ